MSKSLIERKTGIDPSLHGHGIGGGSRRDRRENLSLERDPYIGGIG